ncbi:MAG: prepilin-type N-terminal cleavage/methylation domain-containing protein [Verrucomicrobiota bacterium]
MKATVIKSKTGSLRQGRGFTLIELLVVVTVIAILAGILLPTLAKSKARAQGVFCLNNTKQLTLAWVMYADDHNGRLAYNLGSSASVGVAVKPGSAPMNMNWANNILTWGLEPDNTNADKLVESGLGPYTAKAASVYRCPSDHAVSEIQRSATWMSRVRSYSMNAMVGDAGGFSQTGVNVNNPDYTQFFSVTAIPQPSGIFIFLDEHPDSINDAYFLNKAYSYEWHDLPASYHNGAASFSFADGHSEMHRWLSSTTMPPAVAGGAKLPIKIPTSVSAARGELADFYWVISHMSIEQDRDNSTLSLQ